MAKDVADVKRLLLDKNVAAGPPGAEARVGEAVQDIAKGAAEGDGRLQRALDLLRTNNVAGAVPILRAIADEKTAQIKKDSKDAALAYRTLGAIAGLGDPKQALDAYLKAVELNAGDAKSRFWVGWI